MQSIATPSHRLWHKLKQEVMRWLIWALNINSLRKCRRDEREPRTLSQTLRGLINRTVETSFRYFHLQRVSKQDSVE